MVFLKVGLRFGGSADDEFGIKGFSKIDISDRRQDVIVYLDHTAQDLQPTDVNMDHDICCTGTNSHSCTKPASDLWFGD